jgi:hypothetical protein
MPDRELVVVAEDRDISNGRVWIVNRLNNQLHSPSPCLSCWAMRTIVEYDGKSLEVCSGHLKDCNAEQKGLCVVAID